MFKPLFEATVSNPQTRIYETQMDFAWSWKNLSYKELIIMNSCNGHAVGY